MHAPAWLRAARFCLVSTWLRAACCCIILDGWLYLAARAWLQATRLRRHATRRVARRSRSRALLCVIYGALRGRACDFVQYIVRGSLQHTCDAIQYTGDLRRLPAGSSDGTVLRCSCFAPGFINCTTAAARMAPISRSMDRASPGVAYALVRPYAIWCPACLYRWLAARCSPSHRRAHPRAPTADGRVPRCSLLRATDLQHQSLCILWRSIVPLHAAVQ